MQKVDFVDQFYAPSLEFECLSKNLYAFIKSTIDDFFNRSLFCTGVDASRDAFKSMIDSKTKAVTLFGSCLTIKILSPQPVRTQLLHDPSLII